MQKIAQFISDSITDHLFDIRHSTYNELKDILDSDTLDRLSIYLRREQRMKFQEGIDELLNDSEIEEKVTKLMESRASIVSKRNRAKSTLCTVFYGTNREPNDANDHSKGYGNERAREVSMGSCTVSIPESHNKGEIKGSLWKKLIKWNASYGDLELQKIGNVDEENFWDSINTLFVPLESEEKQALIFIHGYNTSFKDASIRAAQLAVDLAHPGMTAFFSWPSKGELLGYLSDEAAIQYSEKYIADFLTKFAKHTQATRVHIIAHSMGNRGLLEAINIIHRRSPEIEFGQIILAAPDVDADVFNQRADTYTRVSEQTTLYISSKDKAVNASEWIHSYHRAGFTPPVSVVSCMDTIRVDSDVDILELGHGYFAKHKTLLDDIAKLMSTNLHAEHRAEISKELTKETAQKYWKLKV
ncbi:alpha/beta hydrolase [Sulfurovum sp. bin170]|uniref:alpha/beta hydrolase n=1 Tax=Sulfurovum sp. bin170 TaxID=2695268 RepID=UPI0013E02621|nr:alpha/beta hydrolase [Sulfurovum sp. bin170]NEW61516.1 alpha/beta hydrolase [Sulfurovum sp. bin170]